MKLRRTSPRRPPDRAPPGPVADAVGGMARPISTASPADLGLRPGAPVVAALPLYSTGPAIMGVGGDAKALGPTPFRSLLERDLRTLLGANPEIDCYAIEPHELRFFMPNDAGGFDLHGYVPDVVCRYRDGRIVVIDAKAVYFTRAKGWQRRAPFIEQAYLLDHGVPFVVLSEDVIRAEPRLSNAQIMKRHRYIVSDEEALARVRDTIAELGTPTTVGALRRGASLESLPGSCRALSALMNLALAGEISIEIARPFSDATIVWGEALA